MEQLLTTLETTLQAIRKKQAEQTNLIATLNSQLQEKDNQITALTNQLAAATTPVPELPLNPQPKDSAYNGPFVITKGGTYSGNWQSTDSNVPAVEVKTREPVVIENANIRGAGYLVKCWYYDCDLTIRNTRGYGLNPTAYTGHLKPRRFAIINFFRNVVIENCYMEGTAGIYLGDKYVGNGTSEQSIKIRYNQARNIDGRVHNGKDRVQFVQTNFKGAVAHAEIAWNEVLNEPGKSAVEDNINIYNTRGTKASPIRIHHNYIQGAFPVPVESKSYSGGGIIMDSPDAGEQEVTAFVSVEENQLVGVGNYCIGVATGNNILIRGNRCVVSAEYEQGGRYPHWTSGIWAKEYYKKGSTHSVTVEDNVVGVKQTSGKRWDYENIGGVATFRNNASLPDVTRADEAKEWQLWQQRLQDNNIKLGVS